MQELVNNLNDFDQGRSANIFIEGKGRIFFERYLKKSNHLLKTQLVKFKIFDII